MMADTVDLSSFDPFSEDVQQGPVPWWRAMREAGPVYLDPATGYYAVSYEAVEEATLAPDVFSSRSSQYQRTQMQDADTAAEIAAIRAKGWAEVPALLTQDAPMHRRQRILVNKAFSHRRILEVQPFINELVDQLTQDLIDRKDCDFVEVFARPLPLRLIAHLLSVPDERVEDLKRWTDNRFRNLGNKVSREDAVLIAESEVERQQYFAGLLEDRRANPQDDFLTALVEARLGDGDDAEGGALTMEEMLTMVGMLMAAGNETTSSLLAQVMLHMTRHPDDWAHVREHPEDRVPDVVEEALRMFAPTQVMPRITTQDTVLQGVSIPEGSLVQMVFASANRDPERFPDPDTFDPRRPNSREHLAFGRGLHLCLGAALARVEATIALKALAERIETVTLLEDQPRYLSSFRQRGIEGLRVEFVPA